MEDHTHVATQNKTPCKLTEQPGADSMVVHLTGTDIRAHNAFRRRGIATTVAACFSAVDSEEDEQSDYPETQFRRTADMLLEHIEKSIPGVQMGFGALRYMPNNLTLRDTGGPERYVGYVGRTVEDKTARLGVQARLAMDYKDFSSRASLGLEDTLEPRDVYPAFFDRPTAAVDLSFAASLHGVGPFDSMVLDLIQYKGIQSFEEYARCVQAINWTREYTAMEVMPETSSCMVSTFLYEAQARAMRDCCVTDILWHHNYILDDADESSAELFGNKVDAFAKGLSL